MWKNQQNWKKTYFFVVPFSSNVFPHFKAFRVGCAKIAVFWMFFSLFSLHMENKLSFRFGSWSCLEWNVKNSEEVLAHNNFQMISSVQILFPFSQLLRRRQRLEQTTPSATVVRGHLQRSPCHSLRGVAWSNTCGNCTTFIFQFDVDIVDTLDQISENISSPFGWSCQPSHVCICACKTHVYVRFWRQVALVSDVSVAGRFCDVRQHYEHGTLWPCGRVTGHWSIFFPMLILCGCQGHWHGRCNLDEAMGLDQSFKTGVSMNQIRAKYEPNMNLSYPFHTLWLETELSDLLIRLYSWSFATGKTGKKSRRWRSVCLSLEPSPRANLKIRFQRWFSWLIQVISI